MTLESLHSEPPLRHESVSPDVALGRAELGKEGRVSSLREVNACEVCL
eukprot:CAMPEP_0195030248 /NCGR_PEP_ID=MMETSP0326_2-20130528/58474_1 /TAXON_ID=2866 ORGANISM="Crypthecodinium cohnii, Strain Seligo" /NCGR_SAMPLE_ID=MMETSP0326_2 /ASSEMBLY_ACC=CAM_ASM_000348 /LENGTH=47 /DNA_ID= /DNA_START= /DNA_END= /DNA_ORIENTATION=